MGMKLFDDDNDDDVEEISKIEINKEFAKRYEHNKKREDLQKLEEMKKKGVVNESDDESDSESDSDSVDSDDIKPDVQFFDALLKVRNKDPILKQKDAKLFESDDDEEDEDEVDEERENGKRKRKEKPKYLKDVMAQHLVEEGAEFGVDDDDDEDEERENERKKKKKKVKSFAEEQEDLKREVLEAIAKEERENEELGGELLREKKGDDEDEDDDDDDDDDEKEVINEKLNEYFGDDEDLDENNKFLKEFFSKELWRDKDKGKKKSVDDLEILDEDEEVLEKQEDYERDYNFRYEENASDRVMGHSRFVDGSVRKETNARKQQRERKKEREAQAEVERQEEVKRLKNLKKREIQEKLDKIREIAGIGKEIVLTEKDLEEDFDPEDFDKKMKTAFGEEYYQAEDVDPEFGEDESDLEKPDFDKEDELLGLNKDWDVINEKDGFNAEREKWLKSEVGNEDDEDDDGEVGSESDDDDDEMGNESDDQMQPEEGKRKRKRKLSLKEKMAIEEDMEELYKLDYEGTIGDMKTRFKYRPVAPRKYGLNAADILLMDEKELNQYVSLKKLAPYREKEWKVHPMLRSSFMKKKESLLEGFSGKMNKKKRRRTDGGHFSETSKETGVSIHKDVEAQGEQPSKDESKLSRKARRRRNQKEKKMSQARRDAYGLNPSSSKNKPKS